MSLGACLEAATSREERLTVRPLTRTAPPLRLFSSSHIACSSEKCGRGLTLYDVAFRLRRATGTLPEPRGNIATGSVTSSRPSVQNDQRRCKTPKSAYLLPAKLHR